MLLSIIVIYNNHIIKPARQAFIMTHMSFMCMSWKYRLWLFIFAVNHIKRARQAFIITKPGMIFRSMSWKYQVWLFIFTLKYKAIYRKLHTSAKCSKKKEKVNALWVYSIKLRAKKTQTKVCRLVWQDHPSHPPMFPVTLSVLDTWCFMPWQPWRVISRRNKQCRQHKNKYDSLFMTHVFGSFSKAVYH